MNIQKYRKERGMTVQQLADAAGLPKRTVEEAIRRDTCSVSTAAVQRPSGHIRIRMNRSGFPILGSRFLFWLRRKRFRLVLERLACIMRLAVASTCCTRINIKRSIIMSAISTRTFYVSFQLYPHFAYLLPVAPIQSVISLKNLLCS